MRIRIGTLVGAALVAGILAAPGIAGAAGNRGPHGQPWRGGAVFVQTDGLTGNQIVAYDRGADGSLTYAATYPTGGLGGQLNGSVVDHLASQGSLALVPDAGLLVAVNAGSNSISVFSVHGDNLTLRQVLGSGGSFPSSVAVSGNLVYVLNARDGGSLAGFWAAPWGLIAIPGSQRSLGLTTPTDATEFTHTPGEVAFAPDGDQLLVTTKATTSAVDVYRVFPGGWLSASPVVNVEAGAVPFALVFDGAGHVAVANAGTNSVSTYWLTRSGSLVAISTVATGQAATCWISEAQGSLFASNAGSASVSGFSDVNGELSSPTTTPAVGGTVDSAATPGGRFLYVQGGADGALEGFAVGAGGTLTADGSLTVPGAIGGEGIVAV